MCRQKIALERIPDDVAEGEAQPEVCPSVAEAGPILQRFKATPEIQQYKKKSVTREDFLRRRVDKLKLQIQKSAPENNKRDTALLVHETMGGQLQGGLEGLASKSSPASAGWCICASGASVSSSQNGKSKRPSSSGLSRLHLRRSISRKHLGRMKGAFGALVFSDTAAGDDGVGANGGFSWQWYADLGGPSSSFPPM